ncbi:HU family DNA-binding protein [Segatella copri]|uniref:HU family DNA-binding protein n=1 Tax=Segatella copri TaxID=165179 RepID=A0AAW4MWB8_9BACT|nr:HU family DNA-binding protein [Segatella copri]MBV3386897.1 HU family DNA-binding protein [Segatella copri]MBV3394614.1 HU family DNA-binding protein [Segatella copri]MBV3404922.1 HU family DNA-binding protein [Segatella copri]
MSKFSLNTLGKLLADKSGLSQVEAELFIRKMFDVCNQGLEADKQVKIKWLGTFKVQATKDRESINVNTGERFTIEGRDKLTFTPDNILKEIVNKPFAQFETVVVNDGVDFDEIDEKFGEEQTEDAPSEVIDFLDEEEAATPNPDVVVIEPEKEKEKEDELSKQIALEQAKLEKLKQAKLEQERIQKEKLEKEKQEQERLEQERLEQEKLEQERLEQEKLEQERLKQEKLEQERLKQEKLEQEKLELAKQQQALKATVEPAVPATDETEEEDEETSNSHHIVIPRYLVVAVCLIVVALIGGMGWFAFNYGQMTAQRDHLAMQLSQYHQAPAKKAPANAVAAPLSQEQKLRQKAIEDSIRMAKTAEAVKLAEQSDEASDKAENAKQDEAKAKAKAAAKEEDKVASKTESSAHYDKDVRVRTGAYRIVGVAQTVTVGAGQTLEQISNRYLGSGMECYVEALNGTGTVKAGQKIKIPKLELKKKKK